MKKKRVRPFCVVCGADLADPNPSCEAPEGCAKGRALFEAGVLCEDHPSVVSGSPEADFERKHPWRLRDAVFDAWIAAQIREDVGAECQAFGQSYDNWAYGHHRLVALSVIPETSSSPYVLIHDLHDERFPVGTNKLSQKDVLQTSSCVSVCSLEQARAVVRSLVASFGKDVLS